MYMRKAAIPRKHRRIQRQFDKNPICEGWSGQDERRKKHEPGIAAEGDVCRADGRGAGAVDASSGAAPTHASVDTRFGVLEPAGVLRALFEGPVLVG